MTNSWKKDIPDGWKYSMVYNHRGDGSAVFSHPATGRRHRIGSSFDLGWDAKNEPFGAAALRRLLCILDT